VKGTRHTPEQVIRKLREAEKQLASGKEIEEVCRSLEISVQTYHRWRHQYQAMRAESRQVVEIEHRHPRPSRDLSE
jgi:transposase-like protein